METPLELTDKAFASRSRSCYNVTYAQIIIFSMNEHISKICCLLFLYPPNNFCNNKYTCYNIKDIISYLMTTKFSITSKQFKFAYETHLSNDFYNTQKLKRCLNVSLSSSSYSFFSPDVFIEHPNTVQVYQKQNYKIFSFLKEIVCSNTLIPQFPLLSQILNLEIVYSFTEEILVVKIRLNFQVPFPGNEISCHSEKSSVTFKTIKFLSSEVNLDLRKIFYSLIKFRSYKTLVVILILFDIVLIRKLL